MRIPLNKPFIDHREIEAVISVLKSRNLSGDGVVCKEAERLISQNFNLQYVLLTTSATHALELAMLTLNIGLGDEVIMPSFTFVSTANAAVRQGARPVFVDIDPIHLNIDPEKVEAAISPKTKAIICVHYGGFGCQMDKIMAVAKRYNLYVVEDAAHAIGAKYKGIYLGGIGDIGCFSFHETKNLSCGEGGAFLTSDSTIARKAEVMREKGTDRSAFLRGEVDKYTWIDVGSSYVLSEILAAVLLAQLQKIDVINKKRERIAHKYLQELQPLRDSGDLTLPEPDSAPEDESNWHLFFIRVKDESTRDKLLKHLNVNEIKAAFHFVPLHISPFARSKYGYMAGDLPVTEEVSQTLIRLPIYPQLTSDEQQFIIKRVYEFFGK